MRNKKLLSTVVASVLVATTMAVPTMAADGGDLEVGVTTKTAVIRVQVPTKMDISVNQFEMGDDGSQIYSSNFDMENKSEIPVKISVASTVDLKATTKLVESREAAKSSMTEGEVWMAVAAKTGASSFADGEAADVEDLTEGNNNVSTFVQGTDAEATKATTNQTFYLNKSNNMAYKLLNANEDASKIEYAQFYELTAETVSDANALSALLADKEIFVASAAAADGQTLTKVEKGDTHTYDAGEVYYTASLEATAKDSIVSSKSYVYGNGDTNTDGAAAFRYIGTLSGAQETWTKEDISKVTIKYDILGVQESKYTAIKDDCTYGLYKDSPVQIAGTKIAKGDGTTVTGAANIATRLKGTAGTQFQFDVSQANLTGLEVTKIMIDNNEYAFTVSANTASSASVASDGKVYTIKGFTASTVAEIQFIMEMLVEISI